MTTRKKPETGKGKVKTLKLKKETILDLELKNKGKQIKGGAIKKTVLPLTISPCAPCL